MKLLDLKNLFTKKEKRINFNRQRNEDEAKKALLNGRDSHVYGGFRERNTQAIYSPKRTKFKGYMRKTSRRER